MDLAKTVGGPAHLRRRAPGLHGRRERFRGPILPLIAVPTHGRNRLRSPPMAGILTDTENNIKVAIASNYLRPRAAVVDPLMTVTLPSQGHGRQWDRRPHPCRGSLHGHRQLPT